MKIISESTGNYSQTIRIKESGYSEIEVRVNGKELYSGPATHIVDYGNKISFKDMDGKQYEFFKTSNFRLA